MTYVDVHLAFSPFSRKAHTDSEGEGARQFNVWRNVARLFSRTEFVMMLDVDFAVCTDWRGAIRRTIKEAKEHSIKRENDVSIKSRSETVLSGGSDVDAVEVAQMLREGSASLVIPVFEYISQEDGEDQWTFPQDKEVSTDIFLWRFAQPTHFM